MIRSMLLLMFLVAPAATLLAQERGKLEVSEPPMIHILQQFRAGKLTVNPETTTSKERNPANRSVVRGFRVQIYMGPSRSDAYEAQARFQRLFDDIDTYISYEEPNYRVKVGDFRSRSSAEQLMHSLRQQFTNVFVHTEDIFVYH